MNAYLTFKTLHVLSAMVVLGTGIGIAWYTLRGWRSNDHRILHWISRETVRADWLFTASAIVLLLGSAIGMLVINPAWLQQPWLQIAIALTGAVFLLWLPVLALQYRLRSHTQTGTERAQKNEAGQVENIMRLWCALGIIALPLMLAIVYLMVAKPAF